MSAADLLRELKDSLPDGHPEIPGVIRAIEVLRVDLPSLPHSEVMRRTAELLGFEPDNHHNAAICPYCAPSKQTDLEHAMAEVGKAIEALPPHERRDTVDVFLDEMTNEEWKNFVIGVFIAAHERRIMTTQRVTFQLEPERATRLLELLGMVDRDYDDVTRNFTDAQALREDLRLMMERQ